MRWNTVALALAALAAVVSGAHAAPRAVVELFTSPFCSSCPPADELFLKLAQQPGLITLVMPVELVGSPGAQGRAGQAVVHRAPVGLRRHA